MKSIAQRPQQEVPPLSRQAPRLFRPLVGFTGTILIITTLVFVTCLGNNHAQFVEHTNADRSSFNKAVAVTKIHREHSWKWPLTQIRLLRSFRAPETPYSAGHRGIDLATLTGEIVVAPTDGVIEYSGVVVDRPVVTILHSGGVRSSYEPVSAFLEVGEKVSAGTPFGTIGLGLHCEDTCLHIGVRVNGDYVSPLLFFARVPPARLLPLSP